MPLTMTLKKDIPYVEQQNEFYCGAASALMMLNYLDLPVLGANSDKTEQDILDEQRGDKFTGPGPKVDDIDAQNTWATWRTTPQQIVNMIHSSKNKAEVNLWVNYFPFGSYYFLDQLRAITQDEGDTPPAITPIHDGYHWVILSQYVENIEADNKGNTLKYGSFCGRDPLYYETERIDPVDGSTSYLGFINIAETPLSFEKKENHVLIGPSTGSSHEDNTKTKRPGNIPPISLPVNPVSAEEARKIVVQKLKEYGVTTPCLVGRHIIGTLPGPPLRVRRIDRSDSTRDYYLIGMQNQTTRENKMLVRIDIGTGLYLDSLSIRPTIYLLDKPRYNASLVDRVKRRIAFFKRDAQKSTVQRWTEAFLRALSSPETSLVWRPCDESPSAFYPFFEIKENSKVLFYVRIDGQVFDRLTPVPRPLP